MQEALQKLRETKAGSDYDNNLNHNSSASPTTMHGNNNNNNDTSILRSSIGMIPLKVIKTRSNVSADTNPNAFMAAMRSNLMTSNNNSNSSNSPGSSFSLATAELGTLNPTADQLWPSGLSPPRKTCKVWGLENYDEIASSSVSPEIRNNQNGKNNTTTNSNSPKIKSWTAEPLIKEVMRRKKEERAVAAAANTPTKNLLGGENNNNNKNSTSPSSSTKFHGTTTTPPNSNKKNLSPEQEKKNSVDANELFNKMQNMVSDSEKDKLLRAKKDQEEKEKEIKEEDRREKEQLLLETQQQKEKEAKSKPSNSDKQSDVKPSSTKQQQSENDIEENEKTMQNSINNKESTTTLPSSPNAAAAGSEDKEQFIHLVLAIHNKLRAAHSAPPLEYDFDCEASAKKCATRCAQIGKMEHAFFDPQSTTDRQRHGQNIYWHSGKADVEKAIRIWYDEIHKPGIDFENPEPAKAGTGHASQVLWKSTSKVGAAFSDDGKFFCCNYFGAGNVKNKYKENLSAAIV